MYEGMVGTRGMIMWSRKDVVMLNNLCIFSCHQPSG